ncbi:MAG TPA: DedA family protein [Thiolapillus brandeum]|uniref:DedA family protein n=1 Tax=Thiolapillus brandeum TaxID=1076588 RepID=A0A831K5S5_9GAMM|nr:DedA family protein [Thiolapillus brandeum]
MKLFSSLYARAMRWARHPQAPWYLSGMSFAESSFFPVPPDVMLAPMSLARPEKAWFFALITTLASVVGGIAGYLIGLWAFEFIEPLLQDLGYHDKYQQVRSWFDVWGFWAIFAAGFSPIPYKLFTITAGVISMSFLPFILASFIGRGGRFFLVAGLMAWGGKTMEEKLHRYMDMIGWSLVAIIIVAIVWVKIW